MTSREPMSVVVARLEGDMAAVDFADVVVDLADLARLIEDWRARGEALKPFAKVATAGDNQPRLEFVKYQIALARIRLIHDDFRRAAACLGDER